MYELVIGIHPYVFVHQHGLYPAILIYRVPRPDDFLSGNTTKGELELLIFTKKELVKLIQEYVFERLNTFCLFLIVYPLKNDFAPGVAQIPPVLTLECWGQVHFINGKV